MGSEDGNIFIWDIQKTQTNYYLNAKQKSYEFFNPFLISKLDQENYIKNMKSPKGNKFEASSFGNMVDAQNQQNNESDENDDQESQEREPCH